jgi:mercuric reductase
MSELSKFNFAVVGSGSAAFATAIAASRKGASVVMIERGLIGGTCVNVGCIPSKALLAAAEVRHSALGARFPGITTNAGAVDMAALVAGKDDIVETLRHEKYEDLATFYGFSILHGSATFRSNVTLDVDGQQIEADNYVIATGASPWVPPILGLDLDDRHDTRSRPRITHRDWRERRRARARSVVRPLGLARHDRRSPLANCSVRGTRGLRCAHGHFG